MAKIAVIDDDLSADMLVQRLRYMRHDANRYSSMDDAERRINEITSSDLVILDIIMPWPSNKPQNGLAGASTAGMDLLQQIRKQRANTPVIVYSATQDRSIEEAVADDSHTTFVPKWENSLRDFVRVVQKK